MGEDVRTLQVKGIEWRVTQNVNHPTPHLDWRKATYAPQPKDAWKAVTDPKYRLLAEHAAAMQSRANEYHDTTMQQAKRFAELEAELNSVRGQMLDCGSALEAAHDEIARLYNCGGSLFP